MSLVVTCLNCGTVFTMVHEQLEASDGRVRCGHCMEVFDAGAQLTQLSDLDNEHMADRGSNGRSAHLQQDIAHTHLSFVQQAQKDRFWSTPFMRVVLVFVTVLLCTFLALQLVHKESERLTRLTPSLSPIVQKVCSVWPCPASSRRQIDSWLIENSSFQKEGAGMFRLTATLKNTSQLTLLVPQLELSLLDPSDALLVRHVITPDTGNPINLLGGAEQSYHWLITPQTNPNVRLSMKDIVGYRLVLFYP